MGISVEGLKEKAWRLRCRVLRTTDEKTLADYSSGSSQTQDLVVDENDDTDNADADKGTATATAKALKDAVGSAVVIKTLYEATRYGSDRFTWTDHPPRQPSKAATKSQDKVAIRLYKVKDLSKPVIAGRAFALCYYRIEIQNLALVRALAPILLAREQWHVDDNETLGFKRPFRPLYFCYDAFVDKLRSLRPANDNDDALLLPYLKLFVCALDDLFAGLRAKRRALADRGLVTFEHAWTFFPRGAAVRSYGSNSVVLSRVVDTAYIKPLRLSSPDSEEMYSALSVRCQVLRFNGEAYVWEDQALEIARFDGPRPLVDLAHCPVACLPAAEQADLTTRLAARGCRMLDCQGLAYHQYTGIGMKRVGGGGGGDGGGGFLERHNVDGRVLVDVAGYNKHSLAQGAREAKTASELKKTVPGTGRQPDDEASARQAARAASDHALVSAAPVSGGLVPPSAPGPTSESASAVPAPKQSASEKLADQLLHEVYKATDEYAGMGGFSAELPRPLQALEEAAVALATEARVARTAPTAPTAKSHGVARLTEAEQARNKEVMLALGDDHLIFMTPLVEAFALKNKMWLLLNIEDLRPVDWNDQAYDHLVYDEQQKDVILSFVEGHGQTRTAMDDVIIGKGNGLIVLLSGPPGTGKTLTAEAVADRTHRPLFYLQAEDLGINAAQLGTNLKQVFEMATEWDAVVLLDEADVFMAERHPQDIARNELVSIFLRELEYFRGVIFLTTNLYDTIDSAFRSRVSMHLLFRPLTSEARLQVWRKFLMRVVVSEPKGKAVQGRDDTATASSSRVAGIAGTADVDSDSVAASSSGSLPSGLSDEDLVELSAWSLNGREIKTAVKMTATWCTHKGHAMTLERLESGIRVTSPHATRVDINGTDLYDE